MHDKHFRRKHSLTKINKERTRYSEAGFSLTELMISIPILAILSSIAAPSFASMIQDRKINASSVTLSSILALARNHALSTGNTVIVCHAKDLSLSQCSESRSRNTHWSNGIISYADKNNNGELDVTDQILRTIENSRTISIVFNQNGRLRFFPNGGSRSAGFYLCSGLTDRERHVKILYTGRTRSVEKMSERQRSTCRAKAT